MSNSGDTALSARAVAEKVHLMVQGTHGIDFADLFAPDGVLEYPFAPPMMPRRLEGRDTIRAYRSNVSRVRAMFDMEGSSAHIHETADPDVVIVEIEHHGTSHVTGKPYRIIAVGVIEVRNGQIVSYRDYMDPLAVAQLTGRIPQLVDALNADEGAAAKPA
jgi:ketosteroid isomerase-like protein